MKLNEKKFFALAKEEGFESADLTSNESSSLSVSIFHGEVDSLTNNSSYELVARGIYNRTQGPPAGAREELEHEDQPEGARARPQVRDRSHRLRRLRQGARPPVR